MCVASLGRETQEYKVLGHKRELIATVTLRQAIGLGGRKLVKCLAYGVDVDGKKRFYLSSLILEDGVKASQVRQVDRLKPPTVRICNKATVFKELPTTYTHRPIEM